MRHRPSFLSSTSLKRRGGMMAVIALPVNILYFLKHNLKRVTHLPNQTSISLLAKREMR